MTFRAAHYSLASTLLAAVLMSHAFDVKAQVGRYNADERRSHHNKAEDEKATEKFPGASRVSPHLQATKSGGKALNAIVASYQAKNYPDTITQAEALIATSSNAYERSFAYQVAATAAAETGDSAKAIDYFGKAIAANGLDNDDHYAAMYNLVVSQYTAKRNAEALVNLDRLLTETKSDAPEYLSLKGSLLANLDRPAEAAALYEQLYRQNPKDKTSLMNAVALYQQAKNADKADALLLAAKGQGQLNDASQYRALYVSYVNAGKLQDAISTIDDGIAKGIIKPSADLAQVYAVIAQNAYGGGDTKTAIAMYQRAAAIASDGEPGLNLAKVLLNEGRAGEAKKAAQAALDKGVKNPADAKRIIAAGGK